MKRKITTIILFILTILFVSGLAYGAFFVWKIYGTEKKITVVPDQNKNLIDTLKYFVPGKKLALKGEETGRINILFLGTAGKGKPGQNLTDTIMVASVDPKTNQVALLSIPRDLYVKIPKENTSMKINSVYQYGLNSHDKSEEGASKIVKSVVSDVTGLDMNYYVILNFDGFIRIIDAIGGINITSERDIFDPRYPGPNYSYETFELKKGFHKLDGATALKYARERHNDPEGDFGRAKRQQQILAATKSKVFSAGTVFDVFAVNEIFNALGDNVKTDITPKEFESFWEMTKNANTNNINNVVIDAWNKDSLLKVSHVFYGNTRAFVLVPRVGNWSETRELAQNVFDLNTIKRKREEIGRENATVAVINKSGNGAMTEKIKRLLSENLNYKNIITLNDSGKSLENNSLIYDLSEGLKPFTLDDLISKLSAKNVSSLEENYKKSIENVSPDIVIIIGKDAIEKYNIEEDSFEEYNNSSDANEYTEFLNK